MKCLHCSGTGRRTISDEDYRDVIACWNCGGRGQVVSDLATALIWVGLSVTTTSVVFIYLYFGV